VADHACAGEYCRLCDHREVPVLDREGSARRTDPATSKAAAKIVKARATSHRVLIAWAFYDAGAAGLTADEACVAAGLPLFPTEYTTRTSELMREGVVATTGEKRIGSQGLERQVYAITTEGRLLLQARGDR
jgi:hypothetical protein